MIYTEHRQRVMNDLQEMEFMPIVPLGEEELNDEEKGALPEDVPLIALRNTVLFPNVVLPITVAREKSVKAIQSAQKANKWIAVVAQKDGNNEDPSPEDMYSTGTLAKIVKQIKMPDGNTTVFIMGRMRFKVEYFSRLTPFTPPASASWTIISQRMTRNLTRWFHLSKTIRSRL